MKPVFYDMKSAHYSQRRDHDLREIDRAIAALDAQLLLEHRRAMESLASVMWQVFMALDVDSYFEAGRESQQRFRQYLELSRLWSLRVSEELKKRAEARRNFIHCDNGDDW